MNKNTKIWLNYFLGGAISLLLLYIIYRQVLVQLYGINRNAWQHTGPQVYLWLCILLMFVNTSLEGGKWYLLVRSVSAVSYFRAFCSYLVGIAISLVTPNRIGEYPARILYLGRKNTYRYIAVSVLGVAAQLWAIYLAGLIGLIYYNVVFPGITPKILLAVCLLVNILAALTYLKFERWLPALARIGWLRKPAIYVMLLHKIPLRRHALILSISLLRILVFTAQYLFLLKWLNVDVPITTGFCMAALFFWVMAVIPSVALAELGVRGIVSLYLFGHFSSNTVGILAATTGLWLLNLILPSILGCFLMARMKLLR